MHRVHKPTRKRTPRGTDTGNREPGWRVGKAAGTPGTRGAARGTHTGTPVPRPRPALELRLPGCLPGGTVTSGLRNQVCRVQGSAGEFGQQHQPRPPGQPGS